LKYCAFPGVDIPLSRVVLGTGSFNDDRRVEAWRLFDRYLSAGGTALDTAAIYGDGASERVVGHWLHHSGCRNDVVIVTKGGHPSLPDWGNRLTARDVDRDLDESLDRLKTDYIDLYMLHRDDEQLPVDELVDMLSGYVASGRVRAVAVSNWSCQRVQEANDYASKAGASRLIANSVHYSLATPHGPMLPGTVSLCEDSAAISSYRTSQFPVMAWSAQAKGFFSGRYTPSVHDDAYLERVYYHEDNWERLDRVTRLATERGCTTSQLALAWLLNQPLQILAVIGTSREAHLDECLGAVDVSLVPSELAWLNLEDAEPGSHGTPA
jgi:aryl-alcohol dehydrogenase-like predicted oxidoreductase